MTDEELREHFKKIDRRFDATDARIDAVTVDVRAIRKHLNVPEEVENLAHVEERIAQSSGGSSSTFARAAKER